jgi:hypothetical protein
VFQVMINEENEITCDWKGCSKLADKSERFRRAQAPPAPVRSWQVSTAGESNRDQYRSLEGGLSREEAERSVSESMRKELKN